LAVVVDGATLELAGSVSALSAANGNRVNIENDSLSAHGGGLVVSGTNQQVGYVDGTGVVVVMAGSDLTADRIRQNSLTIHGTPTVMGRASINGSSIVAPHSVAQTSVLNSLVIDSDNGPLFSRTYYGRFDLKNQDLIVNFNGAADGGAVLAQINDMIFAAYGVNQDWSPSNGGLTSSTAAADEYAATALGDELGADYIANFAGPGTPIFDEQIVADNMVLVKFTFFGDTGLRGYVDSGDVANWLYGLEAHLTGWVNGKTDYAGGPVTAADLAAILCSLTAESHYTFPL
jgi:hypothetical protein